MSKYRVKAILESRIIGKTTEYLVEWEPSWESFHTLTCYQLIKEFEANHPKEANKPVDNKGDEQQEEDWTQTETGSPLKEGKTAEQKRTASEMSPEKADTGHKRLSRH